MGRLFFLNIFDSPYKLHKILIYFSVFLMARNDVTQRSSVFGVFEYRKYNVHVFKPFLLKYREMVNAINQLENK